VDTLAQKPVAAVTPYTTSPARVDKVFRLETIVNGIDQDHRRPWS
jgi:hypothetical protein